MMAQAAKQRILLVEDDLLIAKTLKMSLSYKGFEVVVRTSFQEGFAVFYAQRFDCVLLDVNLPDGDGMNLCKKIREKNQQIPVLMLTAKTDEASAVKALEHGADDYIRKPYGAQELVARISRLLERKSKPILLKFGALSLDERKRMAWAGAEALSLGKREFDILTLLIRKAGDVLTREELLNAAGENIEIYDRTIDSHLSHLRKKIKEAGASGIQISPVYGVGYRMETLD